MFLYSFFVVSFFLRVHFLYVLVLFYVSKNPLGQAEGAFGDRNGSAEADLGQDALAGQQLSAEADDEAHHGQTAVPGFSEVDEAEACVVRHGGEPVVVPM